MERLTAAVLSTCRCRHLEKSKDDGQAAVLRTKGAISVLVPQASVLDFDKHSALMTLSHRA